MCQNSRGDGEKNECKLKEATQKQKASEMFYHFYCAGTAESEDPAIAKNGN